MQTCVQYAISKPVSISLHTYIQCISVLLSYIYRYGGASKIGNPMVQDEGPQRNPGIWG